MTNFLTTFHSYFKFYPFRPPAFSTNIHSSTIHIFFQAFGRFALLMEQQPINRDFLNYRD